jgi:penicillin G amidase
MSFTFRLFCRFLATAFSLCIILAVITWLLLKGSLPRYHGDARLSGLVAPVTVERDTMGSVTLQAENRLDLAYALGYVHAQERFFEMDLMRRRAAGELAELFGAAAIPTDRKTRKYRMRARSSAMLSQLPSEQRQLLNTYRDGVNQGLKALKVRPFPYWLTFTQPHLWRAEDSLLIVMAMYLTLNDSSKDRELALSVMHETLPKKAYDFLTASGGSWDAPLIGAPMEWPRAPTADELNLQKLDPGLLRHDYEYSDNMPGSNSFAVAGALTNDGVALVANDMHLELHVPSLWFHTRMIYPSPNPGSRDIDVSGASLPGTPIIVAGSNRYIAWSFTNSYGDFADWVRVTLDRQDASRYRGPTEWQSVTTYHETIRVRDGQDETLIVDETHWGPIIATDHDNTPLALAWSALQSNAANLELIKLEQTETVNDAITIAQNSGIPAQNFIVGDQNGNISWTIAGRIPLRTNNYDPQLPADWHLPNTGWIGWLEASQYPLILNPSSQRLWTANTRTAPDHILDQLGDGGYDLGARAKQIRNGLFDRDQFTPSDMLAIQLDHRALFLARWHKLLQASLNQTQDAPWKTEIQLALKDWNGHAATDSVAYRVVRAYRQEITKSILDGFAAAVRRHQPDFKLPKLSQVEHAIWLLIEQRPQHLLAPNYRSWEELLIAGAKQVTEIMQKQPGGITARNWGEYNTARINHPISRVLPSFLASWLNMSADALPGDSNMPRVQSPNFGASLRFAVAPGKEEEGYYDMSGGQSGHPLSPYYGSGHHHWANGNPTSFLPGASENVLRLIPSE